MIADELTRHILTALALRPTAEQARAISTFCRFLSDRAPRAVMVMRGSAGTGKTTLAAAIVKAMHTLKQKLVLLAPTGRAAKVLARYAEQPASTIHRRIYRQRTAADLSVFNLNSNLYHDTLFIIDEASMIANDMAADAAFGTGRLLDDLISYVYSGQNCRMMLIGDGAQLPPVGQQESPALATDVLQDHGLTVYSSDLSEVLRQEAASGILANATAVRQLIDRDEQTQLPKMRVKAFADVAVVPGDELIEQLASSYSRVGIDDTIVVTRSNKRANIYNQGIRRTVLDREEELCRGDQLMVVKNNYNSLTSLKGSAAGLFLANGDRCVVQRIRHSRQLYGFRFADVTLVFPDLDIADDAGCHAPLEITAVTMLDTLSTEAPALTREQHERLYQEVMADYGDLPYKSDRLKRLKTDPYYNALQVKFAYAVTCHKAQGGQWAHVYIDQGYMTDDMLTPEYLHWLYTALTRATERVFLVNWPKTQLTDE